MFMWNFPAILSQRILVGIIFVERLGVHLWIAYLSSSGDGRRANAARVEPPTSRPRSVFIWRYYYNFSNLRFNVKQYKENI